MALRLPLFIPCETAAALASNIRGPREFDVTGHAGGTAVALQSPVVRRAGVRSAARHCTGSAFAPTHHSAECRCQCAPQPAVSLLVPATAERASTDAALSVMALAFAAASHYGNFNTGASIVPYTKRPRDGCQCAFSSFLCFCARAFE